MGNFGGEGLGEQRQRLIFTLQLAAVGEDLAVDFDGAVLEENFVAASVAKGRRGGERDYIIGATCATAARILAD